MMVDDKKSAALISARELPKLVNAAIAAAGHHDAVSPALVVKWDLIGRQIREMAAAEKFAHDVSSHLGAAGHAVTPAVLQIDKRIIAGFFERVSVPQIRELG
jgi:hypothetical protein